MKSLFKSLIIIVISLFFIVENIYASPTNGTIISGGNNGYAWSANAGWINFAATNGSIQISDAGISGYAWSNNYGWINMKPSNGGISISTTGALSGFAWGAGLGWIDFSGVYIDNTGKFNGQAIGSLSGIITFDCTNCSVKTDYIPQNVRVVTSPAMILILPKITLSPILPDKPISSTTPIKGPLPVSPPSPLVKPIQPLPEVATGGAGISDYVYAFNEPLKVNTVQSGTLTFDFADEIKVVLETPKNIYSDDIIFIIKEEKVSPNITNNIARNNTGGGISGGVVINQDITNNIARNNTGGGISGGVVINQGLGENAFIKRVFIPEKKLVAGDRFFNINAFDKKNNPIRKFLKPIQITLGIPDLLRNKNSLGVYFFDEAKNNWIHIPEAVFTKDAATFYVDHLTLFAIFIEDNQAKNIIESSVESSVDNIAFTYTKFFLILLIILSLILLKKKLVT